MPESTRTKKCHVCGVELREGAKVCTNCGAPQLPETTIHNESTAPLSNASTLPNTLPGARPSQPPQLPKRPVPPAPTPIRLSFSPIQTNSGGASPTQPSNGAGISSTQPGKGVGVPPTQPSNNTGTSSTQLGKDVGVPPIPPGSSPVNPPPPQGPIILSPSTMQNGQSQPSAVNTGRFVKPTTSTQTVTSSIDDILNKLNTLIDGAQNREIEQYFPGNLPNKAGSLADWERQLKRVRDCAIELQNPEYQQMSAQQNADILRHLDKAARTLDYKREYTVKLIGGTGAGKSTLLATLIGQDIFPRETGKAITAVPTHVRICDDQESEEMYVHFFSRKEFADILEKTEARSKEVLPAGEAKAIARELQLLKETNTTYSNQYIQEKGHIERIPRSQWADGMDKFVKEPLAGDQNPHPIRLVKYVEFSIRASQVRRVLPPKSILVDLPGAAAGVPRHERIFQSELDTADAIILIVKSARGGDEAATKQLFGDVKTKFVGEKGNEGAAQMVFLVASHWEDIKDDNERKNIKDSISNLLSSLPDNYPAYHTHGKERTYYYQLRTLDALCAASGINTVAGVTVREADAKEYVGTMGTYYEELKAVAKSPLPDKFTAKTFEEITREQHEAMLAFSGLDELARDLQDFLARDRYTAQLARAKDEIFNVLYILEEFCHRELDKVGIHSRTLKEMQEERTRQSNKYAEKLDKRIQAELSSMYAAWGYAIDHYRDNTYQFRSQFQSAYSDVTYQIHQTISQGKFESFIRSGAAYKNEPTMLEEERSLVDINSFNNEIRKYFLYMMEQKIDAIGSALSYAFLQLLKTRESEGTPSIRQIARGQTGEDIELLEDEYTDLIESVKKNSAFICRYIIKAELLDAKKYQLHHGSPEDQKLVDYSYKDMKTVDRAELYRDLIAASNKIMENFVEDTEDRIIRVFEHDLRQFSYKQSDDNDKQRPYVQENGDFTNLIDSLRTVLQKYLHTPDSTLRRTLDRQQKQGIDSIIDRWLVRIRRIKEIENSGELLPV